MVQNISSMCFFFNFNTISPTTLISSILYSHICFLLINHEKMILYGLIQTDIEQQLEH